MAHNTPDNKVKFSQIFDTSDPADRKTKIVCTLGQVNFYY